GLLGAVRRSGEDRAERRGGGGGPGGVGARVKMGHQRDRGCPTLQPAGSCTAPAVSATGRGSGTPAAAASPPAARRPQCASRLMLVLRLDPRRRLGSPA